VTLDGTTGGLGHLLIVGSGAIARRHLANAQASGVAASITIMHREPAPEDAALRLSGADVTYSLGDALRRGPDCAIVATPSPTHVAIASELARSGVHLLVEKPLAASSRDAADLIHVCEDLGVTLLVGYVLRFAPAIRRVRTAIEEGRIGRVQVARADVGQYLPDWRPGRDYRTSVTARRDLGGGALLELSHEIDCLRWLLGDVAAVRAWAGRLGELTIDVEDSADVILQFAGGSVASLHLDLLRRCPSRTGRIDGSEGSVEWDLLGGEARWLRPGHATTTLTRPVDGRSDMYREELAHFADCVAGRMTPLISGEDALETLRVVEAARSAAATACEVRL
jgi:predicted dehydrogenase